MDNLESNYGHKIQKEETPTKKKKQKQNKEKTQNNETIVLWGDHDVYYESTRDSK